MKTNLSEIENKIYSYNITNIDEFYNQLNKYTNMIIPADNFFIAKYDLKKKEISFPFIIDKYEKSIQPINDINSGSLTAKVIREQKSLLLTKEEIADLDKKRFEQELDGSKGKECEQWLGVPLSASYGAIVIQSYNNRPYNKNNINELETIAKAASFKILEFNYNKTLKENKDLKERIYSIKSPLQVILHKAELLNEIDLIKKKAQEISSKLTF